MGTTQAAVSADVPQTVANPQPVLPAETKQPRFIKGKFSIPKSLDDVSLEKGKQGLPGEEEQEAFVAYDTSVVIKKDLFDKAYSKLLTTLAAEGRFRVASLLRQDAYRLDHNKWVQAVPSEVVRKQLADERQLIEFMRAETGISNLILEAEIVELPPNPNDLRPLTNEEKLEQLAAKNPHLRLLMKRFDAYIKYD